MSKPFMESIRINKSFGNKNIISNFSAKFESGLHVITGKNGIGKSTLLNILAGNLSPDSGQICINGFDLKTNSVPAKENIGYVPEGMKIYPYITGNEFITFICRVRKIKAEVSQTWMGELELLKYNSTTFSEMSQGTNKKFFIAAALMHDPDIILLDEPTNALDKHAENKLFELIEEYRSRKVIICATHCDRLFGLADSVISL